MLWLVAHMQFLLFVAFFIGLGFGWHRLSATLQQISSEVAATESKAARQMSELVASEQQKRDTVRAAMLLPSPSSRMALFTANTFTSCRNVLVTVSGMR